VLSQGKPRDAAVNFDTYYVGLSNLTTALRSCGFSARPITAFLYRPQSATVQMLKLHIVYADFHGRDTKSQR